MTDPPWRWGNAPRELSLKTASADPGAALGLLRSAAPMDSLTSLQVESKRGAGLLAADLQAMAAACPNLRALSLDRAELRGPAGAVFEHLTSLELRDCTACGGGGDAVPIPGLQAPDLHHATPRLAALRVYGATSPFCAGLAAGHPSVRELKLTSLGAEDEADDGDHCADAWLWAASRMPKLEVLEAYGLARYAFDRIAPFADAVDAGGAPLLGEMDLEHELTSSVLHRVCFYLSRCAALTSLDIDFEIGEARGGLGAALASIGAAAGPRLTFLCLRGFELPSAAPGDAGRVLYALPLFSDLDELHLDFSDAISQEPHLEARVHALLAPLPALRQHCPKLASISLVLPDWAPTPGMDAAFDAWREGMCAAHPGLEFA
ncbi:MAG: hypothetical protein J3K34DRAFT_415572 [Monoraphidium minutum]|nr:MAG: hypothetical protein J3K34DRAFT_415572 [Monoraphidium minutum]